MEFNNSSKAKPIKTEDKKGFFKSVFFDTVLPIMLGVIVALILKNTLFFNAIVPSESMEPNIMTSDRLIGSRLAYKTKSPKRADIITFDALDEKSTTYLKRVIGLPGEYINIVNGKIYIDNAPEPLDEPYINTLYASHDSFGPYYVPKSGDKVTVVEGNTGPICYINNYYVGNKIFLEEYCTVENNTFVVKNDCYFVMGDNRNNSYDSRYWETTNFVSKDDITSKIIFRYYPSFKTVKYFSVN